jgi:hypothetical protein
LGKVLMGANCRFRTDTSAASVLSAGLPAHDPDCCNEALAASEGNATLWNFTFSSLLRHEAARGKVDY